MTRDDNRPVTSGPVLPDQLVPSEPAPPAHSIEPSADPMASAFTDPAFTAAAFQTSVLGQALPSTPASPASPSPRPRWALPVIGVLVAVVLVAGATFGQAYGQRTKPIDRTGTLDPLDLPTEVVTTVVENPTLGFVRVLSPNCADLTAQAGSTAVLRCVIPGTILPTTNEMVTADGVDRLRVYDVISEAFGFVAADAVEPL